MSSFGKTAWNKGRKFAHSKQHEDNRIAAIRKWARNKNWPRGYSRPKEHTQPMLNALKKRRLENPQAHREMVINNLPKDTNGSKNGNWKGGITAKTRGVRWSKEYKNWRKTCLVRDGYKCKACGSTDKLSVHHIIAISECPEIATLRMNGVTLCHDCHYKYDEAWRGKRFKKRHSDSRAIALIFSIPHKLHEYATCGNWQFLASGAIVIFISREMPDDSQLLVAFHELVEAMMCRANGVTQQVVDEFDIQFEKNRFPDDDSEPGDHKEAPYAKQHGLATAIERIVAEQMGVNWLEHESAIGKLFE